MSVEMKTPLVDCGLDNGETTVHITKAELITELDQKNQLARVVKILKRKQVPLDTSNYTCFGDTLSLLVIDRKNNLRGSYLLEHSDINRMFVELDIVKLQENYGREVSR